MSSNSGQAPDLAQSVAGEEDPGASVDVSLSSAQPGRSGQPAGSRPHKPSAAQARMKPSDEAPAGTGGTGEDLCPRCGGSGTLAGRECPECLGTGKVNVGIGGA